jgi:hypothetical protein
VRLRTLQFVSKHHEAAVDLDDTCRMPATRKRRAAVLPDLEARVSDVVAIEPELGPTIETAVGFFDLVGSTARKIEEGHYDGADLETRVGLTTGTVEKITVLGRDDIMGAVVDRCARLPGARQSRPNHH